MKDKNESIDVLHLKIKTLTILVVLLIMWQVISFLRVNTVKQDVEDVGYALRDYPKSHEVEINTKLIDYIQKDIEGIYDELQNKAGKSWVKEWCR